MQLVYNPRTLGFDEVSPKPVKRSRVAGRLPPPPPPDFSEVSFDYIESDGSDRRRRDRAPAPPVTPPPPVVPPVPDPPTGETPTTPTTPTRTVDELIKELFPTLGSGGKDDDGGAMIAK